MSTVINHSGDTAKYTKFDPTGTQWKAEIKDVQSALALIGPWARTDIGIPVASTTVKGIAALATQAEIDEGKNTDKIVTPAMLAYRVSKPEASYTVTGTTRYANSTEVMDEANSTRTVVPKQLHEAITKRQGTEAKQGTYKIATDTMAKTGSDNTTVMTPSKVKLAIQSLVPSQATASESAIGITKLATVQEAIDGVGREGVAISPYSFARANGTESKFGTVKIATASDMKSDTTSVVSTARFRNQRATTTEVGTTQLTEGFGQGNLALSSNAPVVKRTGDNMSGRLQLNGDDYITRGELNLFAAQVGFIMMAAYWSGDLYGGQWAPCDGRSLNKNSNPVLFSRIGYTYGGSGDWFNIPNMQDIFPRGASGGRPVGVRQDDAMQRMSGQFISYICDSNLIPSIGNYVNGVFADDGPTGTHGDKGVTWNNEVRKFNFDNSRQVRTDWETRPANMALWFIIRIA